MASHHEHQSRADADDEKRHVPAKEVTEVCSDRNAQHCRHNGAAHHGGQSDGSLAVRCHTGGKRRHDRPEDRMRERHADTGRKKRLKTLHPWHHEVTQRKNKEQHQEQFATLKTSRNDRERQRHDCHHKSVTRQDETGERHRLVETGGNVGEQPHGQEFARVENKSGKGKRNDRKPGSETCLVQYRSRHR